MTAVSNNQLTIIRTVATAGITALAVLYSYFPSDVWITTVVAAAGAVGIHAIPAIQQGVSTLIPVPTQKGTVTVSEQPAETAEVAPKVAPQHNPSTELDGLALMGLRAPVTDSGQPEAAPVATVQPVPELAPTAPVVTPVGTPPVTAAKLRELADFLENL